MLEAEDLNFFRFYTLMLIVCFRLLNWKFRLSLFIFLKTFSETFIYYKHNLKYGHLKWLWQIGSLFWIEEESKEEERMY